VKSGERVLWSHINPHLEPAADYIEVWQDGGVADHFGLLRLCPRADLRPCKAGATPLLVDRMAYRRWRGMEYPQVSAPATGTIRNNAAAHHRAAQGETP
jgi:hypothetical protein